jgi:hypothetical protein
VPKSAAISRHFSTATISWGGHVGIAKIVGLFETFIPGPEDVNTGFEQSTCHFPSVMSVSMTLSHSFTDQFNEAQASSNR